MHKGRRMGATRGSITTAAFCTLALTLSLSAGLAGAQSTQASSSNAAAASQRNWWKNAVIYEVYPRSFQDTNGDGIGDLNGIIEHLDYLQKLGVDAIWLTPVYPSPQVDFGYDISHYRAIDPMFGSMADFNRLVAEASKRHIRVIMDMVMNHTSDQDPWFLQSRSSRTNPYRDWYVWRSGKGETATSKGQPPNNWESVFGGSAWQWDPKTRQYYYHAFYVQQPDLNWYNPKVHKAFKDIMSFWLERGVAGFRFDAITQLFEDPSLANAAVLKGKDGQPLVNAFGEPVLDDSKTNNLPGVNTVMQEMRAHIDTFDSDRFPGTRVLIGETYLPTIADLRKMYGPPGKPEFELPMDTQLAFINKLSVPAFRAKLIDAETRLDGNIPLLLFDNHDNQRIDMRYGDGVHNVAIERALATVLFMSRGAALMYYGDEIGMKTTPPTRKQDVKDPQGITGWPKNKGRDGERTPTQWTSGPEAGFTAGKPWLPIPPTAAKVNVQTEESNPDSMFNWYRTLIRLKKTTPALQHGNNTMLDTANDKVLSWMRKAPGAPPVVVSVNFTAQPQTVDLAGAASGNLRTLVKSPGGADPSGLSRIELQPFGIYVGEVQ